MPIDPSESEVAALADAVAGHSVVVACTFDAVSFPGQARLVERLARSASRLVAVALRTPYDVELYPADACAVATYGIQPPQIQALADALLGAIPFAGHLPVRLRGAADAPANAEMPS